MKSSDFWKALRWLHSKELLQLDRGHKRGYAILTLKQPVNIGTDVEQTLLELTEQAQVVYGEY